MKPESRRSFLRRWGRVALAPVVARALGVDGRLAAGELGDPLPAPARRPTTALIDGASRSVVADVRRPEVIDGARVHETLLGEMIEDGLRLATGRDDPVEAWRSCFQPDDIIGIKFNSIGETEIGTSVPFAVRLVASLERAGFDPDRIMLIEVPRHPELRALRTRPVPWGFTDREVPFGSGSEQLAVVLEEITALISVPFLKTHNIAGFTGCLKNLSHALIRRPGRYHGNACSPYVGDIVALPQIRSKLRLSIVNGLRGVFDGGPAADPGKLWQHAGVLVGMDPVAVDAVGLDVLNAHRRERGLHPIGDLHGRVPHLHAAAERGLGTVDQDYIRVAHA